ncbi:MAG: Fic family protein [bacterium]
MKDLFQEIDRQKDEINAHRPFEGELLHQLRNYYKIGLTYASNALEGNSLTEMETKIVLEDGLTVGGKPIRDYYEATGHGRAYDYIYSMITGGEVSEEQIKTVHRLFYSLIDDSQAGKYREQRLFISGSNYVPPEPKAVPELMAKFVSWLNDSKEKYHPVEYAALTHKKFVFIHPFVDGNGRVARLIMNLCLLRAGYTIAIIPPILRGEYISLLEKAHDNDRDFVRFIAERVIETQKDYLRLLGA